MIAVVRDITERKKADKALRTLARGTDKAWVIGEVAAQRRGKRRVEYR